MGRVLVYSTTGCPHCVRAIKLLEAKGVAPVIIDIGAEPARRDEMVRLAAGRKTVPQIFFNNDHIGGADDLESLEEEGTLDQKLNSALEQEVELDVKVATTVEAEAPAERSETREFFICVDMLGYYDALKYGAAGIKRKKRIFRDKTKSFKGYHLMGKLVESLELPVGEALNVAQRMLDLEFIAPLKKDKGGEDKFSNDNTRYYFVEDWSSNVLNHQRTWTGAARSANAVAADLQHRMLRLADLYISDDGRQVDYERCGKSDAFREYRVVAMELQRVDISQLSSSEAFAFWLNLYNALVVHANIQMGPPSNMFERARFFSGVCYQVGGERYSLSIIEHGILRQNRKPPNAFSRLLKKGDPRTEHIVDTFEPSIHFALVCGAKSCPPIRVYCPENLHTALRWATEGFCSEEVTIDMEKRTVTLSMLFKWYGPDFGRNQRQRLLWIREYLIAEEQEKLDTLLASGKPKIKYSTYNWDINSRYSEDESDCQPDTDQTLSFVDLSSSATAHAGDTTETDVRTGGTVCDGRGQKRRLSRQHREIDLAEVELGERVGGGGSGEVYEAMWRGQKVAVKKLLLEGVEASGKKQRSMSPELAAFLAEVNTLSKLTHHHILQLLGVAIAGTHVCLVSEFAQVGDLHSLLCRGELTLARKLRMLWEIADAMEYLHAQTPPIVHGDLKCTNVLIMEDHSVSVGDVGLAKALPNGQEHCTRIGTVNYVAPEVVSEKGAVSPRAASTAADVFSFGMIMFEMMKEKAPFEGMDRMQIIRALGDSKRPSVGKEWDKDIVSLMKKCWKQRPSHRPPFSRVKEDLQAMLFSRGVALRDYSHSDASDGDTSSMACTSSATSPHVAPSSPSFPFSTSPPAL